MIDRAIQITRLLELVKPWRVLPITMPPVWPALGTLLVNANQRPTTIAIWITVSTT